ncbi:hypothetical protein ACFL0F_02540, partial [Patescibacteria group bacterium]
SDLEVGTFTNIALASGHNREDGSEGRETSESSVASSTVAKGVVLSLSTGVGGTVQGAVLGAATELPATGTPTVVLILLLILLAVGIALKMSGKTKFPIFEKVVSKMKKTTKISVILALLVLPLMTKDVRAVADTVYLQDLPSYLSTDNFKISYTAISNDLGAITASVSVRKDGDGSWRLVDSTSGPSAQVTVDSGDLYDGEGKYFFKIEINGGTASDETSTIIDRSGPDSVRDYRKEDKGNGQYKLLWKNPSNEDFDKVVIYRSDEINFTADSNTEVASVSGSRDSDMTWEGAVAPGKPYYFALRAVDKAGNASSVVADPETQVVEAGEVLSSQTTAGESSSETEVKQYPAEGKVLGEEDSKEEGDEDKEKPEIELYGEEESTEEASGILQENKNYLWVLGGVVLLGALYYIFIVRKKK